MVDIFIEKDYHYQCCGNLSQLYSFKNHLNKITSILEVGGIHLDDA